MKKINLLLIAVLLSLTGMVAQTYVQVKGVVKVGAWFETYPRFW